MKREARILLEKSTDSVLLAIEHFNRPWNRGRAEAVLILLDRAFELLLKSAIVYKGGRIREPRAKETIGFDVCVRRCVSDEKVKSLTETEALTVQMCFCTVCKFSHQSVPESCFKVSPNLVKHSRF